MKTLSTIIAIVTSLILMAIVADTFGAFFTAVFGIVAYKLTKWFELYFSSIEI